MSFEIYIQWFRDGHEDWVGTDELSQVFGAVLVAEDNLEWRLSFGPNLKPNVYLTFNSDDTSKVCSITVNRPSSADAM
jgi:hypothetical protein